MPDVSTEVAIATTTVGSATSTITFSSIPSTYTDLKIIVSGYSTASGSLSITLNGTTTGYSETKMYGEGSITGSNRASNSTEWDFSSTSTTGTLSIIDLFSYSSTSVYKTAIQSQSNDKNGSGESRIGVFLWRNTAAVTSFTLTTNQQFTTNTTVTVYGIL